MDEGQVKREADVLTGRGHAYNSTTSALTLSYMNRVMMEVLPHDWSPRKTCEWGRRGEEVESEGTTNGASAARARLLRPLYREGSTSHTQRRQQGLHTALTERVSEQGRCQALCGALGSLSPRARAKMKSIDRFRLLSPPLGRARARPRRTSLYLASAMAPELYDGCGLCMDGVSCAWVTRERKARGRAAREGLFRRRRV